MGLKERTIHASKWSVGSSVLMQGMQLVFSVVMARILAPRDFGIYGMAFVFILFLQLFSKLGMGAALIQKKDLTEESISTVFWLNVITGAVLASIFAFSAPAIAAFFREPVLTNIVRVLSINFIIVSLSIVQSTLLTRELRFKKIAVVGVASLVVSSSLGISLALGGLGVWSLVWITLSSNLITGCLMWYKSEWYPKFIFRPGKIRTLVSFGSHMLGVSMVTYFARNIQDILIGRFLTPAALGYYSLANRIMMLPLQHISERIITIIFPALSKIQHDTEAVQDAMWKMELLVSIVTFPIIIGLAMAAPELILVVLGEKWQPAVPVIQVLCIAGLMRSICSLYYPVMLSQGRANLLFRAGLLYAPILCCAIALGLRWGILGVAVCYTAAIMVVYPLLLGVALHLIRLKAGHFLKALLPAMTSALVMVIFLATFRYVAGAIFLLSDIPLLIGTLLFGVGVYLGVLRAAFPAAYKEIRGVVKVALSSF